MVKKLALKKLIISAMMLALCLLLPFLTGQIREFGAMLCPMHLPVLLCGFLCGPIWGLAVGITAAPLRCLLFGMPKVPICLYMAVELAVYGLLAGLFYKIFPKKAPYLYLSLILSMTIGRLVNGALAWLVAGISGGSYSFSAFLSANVIGSWPGIVLQIILVPLILLALEKAGQFPLKSKS